MASSRPAAGTSDGELANCALAAVATKRSTSVARLESASEYTSSDVSAAESAVTFQVTTLPGAMSARMMSKLASAAWPAMFLESCSVRPVRLTVSDAGPASTDGRKLAIVASRAVIETLAARVATMTRTRASGSLGSGSSTAAESPAAASVSAITA